MTTQTISEETGFRPLVGTCLMGAGTIIEHSRILDSLGRFHGLIRLTVTGAGDMLNMDLWEQMLLKGAVVKAVIPDAREPGKYTMLYKFEEPQP